MSLVNMSLGLKDLIAPAVAVAAVAVGIWQYRLTSQSEFTKPLREAQLRLYQEASLAASQIATLQHESPEWAKAKQNFLGLFYGPLAIFEDFDHVAGRNDKKLSVELAMIIFKSCMDDEQLCKELDSSPKKLSLALAHSCRESLGRMWGYTLKQLEGDYQKNALEYWNKLQAREVAKNSP
jgi:hypothetical protein